MLIIKDSKYISIHFEFQMDLLLPFGTFFILFLYYKRKKSNRIYADISELEFSQLKAKDKYKFKLIFSLRPCCWQQGRPLLFHQFVVYIEFFCKEPNVHPNRHFLLLNMYLSIGGYLHCFLIVNLFRFPHVHYDSRINYSLMMLYF
jgi:hypothetical protein